LIHPSNIIYLKNRWEEYRSHMPIEEQRSSDRHNCEVPVIIEECETGELYDGSIYNYSRKGMYLELDHPLNPGKEIRIEIEKSELPFFPQSCCAKVVWCEEIPGAVVLYTYGVGVQHDLTVKTAHMADKLHVIAGGLIKDDSL
jgi:hypothetical protein